MALLALAWANGAAADVEMSDPLIVPADPLPVPEDAAPERVDLRVSRAAAVLNRHGFDELPLLAWALLYAVHGGAGDELVDQAVALAPHTPGVRFEAAALRTSPSELFAAFVALGGDFPGVLWLIQVFGAALGVGLLVGGGIAVGVALLRSVPQHAHSFGHLGNPKDFVALPVAVIGSAAIGLLSFFGVGPALLLALVGGLAAFRLARREAFAVAATLVLLGASLGPLLECWSRFSTSQDIDAQLLVAWRAERSQPLPRDVERLEAVLRHSPRDLSTRLALATVWKRQGDLEQALRTLGELPRSGDGPVLAAAYNLRGIIELAQGRAKDSIDEFEWARTAYESAPVLFNLSQAYGRSLRLLEQTPVFNAARAIDHDLVSRYMSKDGRSIHDHLIQGWLPLWLYLERAFAPDTGSRALVRDVRSYLLGPGVPDWAWLMLPIFGVLGAAVRRVNVGRCRRCGRAICADCTPELQGKETCVRCEALFGRGTISDPRLHAEQLRSDRRRQRTSALNLALAGLLLPGAPDVFQGRVGAGTCKLCVAAIGLFLLLFAPALPSPWALGGLADALCRWAGLALLLPLYLRATLRSLRGFAEVRALA